MENHGESTDVQKVQMHRSTVVQTNVAIEMMVAVGFRKRGPKPELLRIV